MTAQILSIRLVLDCNRQPPSMPPLVVKGALTKDRTGASPVRTAFLAVTTLFFA